MGHLGRHYGEALNAKSLNTEAVLTWMVARSGMEARKPHGNQDGATCSHCKCHGLPWAGQSWFQEIQRSPSVLLIIGRICTVTDPAGRKAYFRGQPQGFHVGDRFRAPQSWNPHRPFSFYFLTAFRSLLWGESEQQASSRGIQHCRSRDWYGL